MTDKPGKLPQLPLNTPFMLDEELLERIADKAAEKAVALLQDRLYQEVGKQFVSKLLWAIGVAVTAAWAFLHQGKS